MCRVKDTDWEWYTDAMMRKPPHTELESVVVDVDVVVAVVVVVVVVWWWWRWRLEDGFRCWLLMLMPLWLTWYVAPFKQTTQPT